MQSTRRSLNVIVVPADEYQPPGWFAMHPSQYSTDPERNAAHGRWHCLSSPHGHVYRALRFQDNLPINGLALDWQARNILGQDQRTAIAEHRTISLELRPARWDEFPRCLIGHPNPAVRLGSVAATLAFLLVLAGGLVAGYRWQHAATSHTVADLNVSGVAPDAATVMQTMIGEWRGPDERLVIMNDKGVIEIVRQTRVDDGKLQLDLHIAAPVRVEQELNQVELLTSEGSWIVRLVPGMRRVQLAVTYPDKSQVSYE